ncbi:AraC family transcriptional regulator [Acinetobacter sp. C26M]|uniref:AraC family transcriptional regulator n=1 Tax=unclassified Acinetobacter TaxID=196816 RepID=UPI001423EA2B|nr:MULTISPECIES: AraC family transcriptional regulator [unclassified Acinetobacter]NIE96913.1 AraC family transcriptional regulator [Acinetobacter sp. Tr-809]USA45487.1 AraC family transcriptional regulator [Acinetobacter sp. C26M]USA48989.1 AraC family transcriptional regulator [Acinetobacter sp. C26G]
MVLSNPNQVKLVSSSMLNLLIYFCVKNNLKNAKYLSDYKTNELIPVGEWIELLEEINQKKPKPALGLEISSYTQPKHLGILGYIASSCENILEVLNLFIKYQRLFCETKPAKMSISDQFIVISWGGDPYLKNNQLVDELLMGVLYTFLGKLVHPDKIEVYKIIFSSEKTKFLGNYESFFGCPVEFEGEDVEIYIPMTSLDLTVSNADPVLNDILIKQANLLLSKRPKLDVFDELIQKTIIQAVHKGNISVDYVANKLGLPSRIFQLKLKQQGYTFKERLNQVRRDLAFDYLADLNLSILDISMLLAYQEQTSFIRAFKSWTGMSPLQYRKKRILNQRS